LISTKTALTISKIKTALQQAYFTPDNLLNLQDTFHFDFSTKESVALTRQWIDASALSQ
jgi:hypothetical protein